MRVSGKEGRMEEENKVDVLINQTIYIMSCSLPIGIVCVYIFRQYNKLRKINFLLCVDFFKSLSLSLIIWFNNVTRQMIILPPSH